MNDSIPTYVIDLDSCEMTGLALVSDPAIESDFQFFGSVRQAFSIQDEAQHIVFGPCLRVDYPILRQAKDGSYYNILFTKDVAQKMVSQFLSSDTSLNLSHTCIFPDGIEPLSFFIKDSSRGISPSGYDDIADGSVFCSYHVSNDVVWQSVVDGTFRGFSIECLYDYNPISDMSFSSLFTRVKAAFAELNVVPASPSDLFVEGELAVGSKVYIDEVSLAPDGVYVTVADDPQDIIVANGVVSAIEPHKAEEAPVEEPKEADEAMAEESVEAPAEEPVAEEPKEPEADPMAEIKDMIAKMDERLIALESRVADIEGKPQGELPQDQFRSVKPASQAEALSQVRSMFRKNF